jgi:hypothetical protein
MKKDLSQLGIIPSLSLGLLGYTSGIGLLQAMADWVQVPLHLASVATLEHYRLAVAVLWGLSPWAALGLWALSRGPREPVALGYYALHAGIMVLAVTLGLCTELWAMQQFQADVETLVPGAQWSFSVEELSPFRSGFGSLLLAMCMAFLIGLAMRRKQEKA